MPASFRQLLYSTVLIIFFATSTSAETNPAQPKAGLITDLLDWIANNSDYDTTFLQSNPPLIEFCECGEIILYEGKPVVIEEHLKGLYDKPNRKITLVRPWDASKVYDVSILLHELIHFVQYNNKEWVCWNETEWEAYKLQEAWLLERGHDPAFNWVQIYFLARCPFRDPSDIHPFKEHIF